MRVYPRWVGRTCVVDDGFGQRSAAPALQGQPYVTFRSVVAVRHRRTPWTGRRSGPGRDLVHEVDSLLSSHSTQGTRGTCRTAVSEAANGGGEHAPSVDQGLPDNADEAGRCTAVPQLRAG